MLLRDAVAYQIAQGVNGGVGNLVIHAGAAAFAFDKALLHQHRQVARHIGGCVATGFGQLAHVVLGLAQQVQDAQARGLGQRLEIVGHTVNGLIWELGHVFILAIFN